MEDVVKEHFELLPLKFKGKKEFLYYVGAKDCIKEEVR